MQTPLSILLKEKSSKVQTITANDTCYDCAALLSQLGIGALLVMEGDKVQGIISERDLINKLVSKKLEPTQVTVSEVMTHNVLTVPSDTTVQKAMEIITEKRFRHLPVVDNGKLVGIISIGDITRWIMLQQQQEISALTDYIHG
ncbi:CBS domain-containing protein [Candidatus Berkiella aquae]|uniref:CBS domain-containing protein n=1 Tax=Candidatus Berkiella aquae TaxID=295108 RepID=A0A0Q9YP42_9GAMM|nr:CBS domain-containing protein [Candidatus Berkiella aquae]MCS5712064.1 CBS domain-containing protein [Candidatus Berkiella aquae]